MLNVKRNQRWPHGPSLLTETQQGELRLQQNYAKFSLDKPIVTSFNAHRTRTIVQDTFVLHNNRLQNTNVHKSLFLAPEQNKLEAKSV